MSIASMEIVFLGLSITSAWGNGHATTYRSLLKSLAARGHRVLFLERDRPWYAASRDLPHLEYCENRIYGSMEELKDRFSERIAAADAVIVGSYVPDGVAVGEWVIATAKGPTAFYDIDTPVTLYKLERGDNEYIAPELIPRYDAYLAFSGGPRLRDFESLYRSPMAVPLYCSADPDSYRPAEEPRTHALGYLGTYSRDRQDALERLMLEPARRWREGRFIVAGSQYPRDRDWPANVEYREHISPGEHRSFYASQAFTLNVTRQPMVEFGYSPSVRLFEAGACGVPVITDCWPGIESFFVPGKEILPSRGSDETLRYLNELSEADRIRIGRAARRRVLAEHTAGHRAEQLEGYILTMLERRAARAI